MSARRVWAKAGELSPSINVAPVGRRGFLARLSVQIQTFVLQNILVAGATVRHEPQEKEREREEGRGGERVRVRGIREAR